MSDPNMEVLTSLDWADLKFALAPLGRRRRAALLTKIAALERASRALTKIAALERAGREREKVRTLYDRAEQEPLPRRPGDDHG